MNQTQQAEVKNVLLFDGECPFCRSISQYYALRKALPNLETRSMRDPDSLRDLRMGPEVDLSKGMILILADGRIVQGRDAYELISKFSAADTPFSFLLNWIGKSSVLSRIVYPLALRLRRMMLFLKGVDPHVLPPR